VELFVSITPARRAALIVLHRVRERGSFGPETLDAVLRASGLSPRDTALATRLTYGVLQTLGTLDEAIDRFARVPAALEPGVRDALRLGAYEILFMRTPARAAVNEGVEAARKARPQAAGFANAVLRRIAEQADSFPWGDPATDDEALARATGHPRWIVDRWIAELGRERASEALYADLEPAPLYLWANTFKAGSVEILDALEADGARPVPDVPPGCIRAEDAAAAVRGVAVRSGLALVTDAAAQLAAHVLGAHPGDVVVDVASGRGTKTVEIQALSTAAGAPCDLYALDIHPFKADVLRSRMAELGVPRVTTLVGDATDVSAVDGLPAPGTVEAVLLDVPCSGLGALRRRPEKRWRVTPDDIDRLAVLQRSMLDEAATLVSVGGRVVYSTCTISRTENEDVISSFVADHAGAFMVGDLSAAVPPEWKGDIGEGGLFQSTPRVGGPDGHFVALLVRVS
jgi:16S rRNA (cytosine967-C5)-methyltransferase